MNTDEMIKELDPTLYRCPVCKQWKLKSNSVGSRKVCWDCVFGNNKRTEEGNEMLKELYGIIDDFSSRINKRARSTKSSLLQV